jgi:hypothetical protein
MFYRTGGKHFDHYTNEEAQISNIYHSLEIELCCYKNVPWHFVFLLNCKYCKVLADDHEYHFFINCKIYPENKILFLINVINKCYAQFQSFDNFVKLKFIINTSEFLCRVNKAITGITKMKSTTLFLYVTYFVIVFVGLKKECNM